MKGKTEDNFGYQDTIRELRGAILMYKGKPNYYLIILWEDKRFKNKFSIIIIWVIDKKYSAKQIPYPNPLINV